MSQGHDKTAKVIVDGGAELSIRNNAGQTALDMAIEKVRSELIRFLK